MRLHEADCHLEYARLYLAHGEKDQAREHLAKAKALIEQTGYHRRDKEVQELETMINAMISEVTSARRHARVPLSGIHR